MVGISIDGTKLWQLSCEQFAVGSWGAVSLWVHGCYSRAQTPPKFFATLPTKRISTLMCWLRMRCKFRMQEGLQLPLFV